MRVTFNGAARARRRAKDMILGLIAQETTAGATGHVVEYSGEAIRALSMEGRMTVSNMSIESGARAGLIAPDETTPLPQGPAGRAGAARAGRRALVALRHRRGRGVRPRVDGRRLRARAAGHLGHEPRSDRADHRRRADAGQRGRAASARLHGPRGRRSRSRARPSTASSSARAPTAASATCARRPRSSAARSRRGVHALVVPGSRPSRPQAEAEGLDRVFAERASSGATPGARCASA